MSIGPGYATWHYHNSNNTFIFSDTCRPTAGGKALPSNHFTGIADIYLPIRRDGRFFILKIVSLKGKGERGWEGWGSEGERER